MSRLTARQQQYIWLVGSHPELVATQGRGYRGRELRYGIDDGELVIFGYSTPFLWLKNGGLVRTLANNPRGYVLTDAGEKEFQRLLLNGFGAKVADILREVKVAPRAR